MRSPEAYVAATRRIRADFVATDYYRGLFESLRPIAAAYGCSADFHVTYSTERNCETVKFGNQTVIIYDQYLGQTFNQMNRLWLNSSNPEEAEAYALKVMAERAQVTGRLQLALILAASYRVMDGRSQTYKTDHDARRRGFLTFVQERYVLVHELFHAILDQQPTWRADAIRDARGDFIENRLRPLRDETGLGGESAAQVLMRQSLDEQIALMEADDALVEECVCDTLAIPVVLQDAVRQGFSPADARSAVFFALRHLRKLASLRATVDRLGEDDDPEGAWIYTYLVRTGFQQWVLNRLAAEGLAPTSDASDAAFMAEQARYETYLEDPILLDAPHRLKRLPADILDATEDYAEIVDLNRKIDELLANPAASERMARLGESAFLLPLANVSNEDIARIKRELDERP